MTIKDITFAYENSNPVFQQAAIDLPRNGIVELHGGNGMGKTTLLKLLGGVLPCASASMNLWRSSHAPLFIDENILALPFFSTQEYVRFLGTVMGIRIPMGHNSLITDAMIHQRLDRLSLGQRKRLMLSVACAVGQRSTLLLDEPFNGLDRDGRVQARHQLSELSDNQLIVIATHEGEMWGDWFLDIVSPTVISGRALKATHE